MAEILHLIEYNKRGRDKYKFDIYFYDLNLPLLVCTYVTLGPLFAMYMRSKACLNRMNV